MGPRLPTPHGQTNNERGVGMTLHSGAIAAMAGVMIASTLPAGQPALAQQSIHAEPQVILGPYTIPEYVPPKYREELEEVLETLDRVERQTLAQARSIPINPGTRLLQIQRQPGCGSSQPAMNGSNSHRNRTASSSAGKTCWPAPEVAQISSSESAIWDSPTMKRTKSSSSCRRSRTGIFRSIPGNEQGPRAPPLTAAASTPPP
ncbi:MAG: hypothetical protein JWN43_2790 [Gammaproteobacteria bacterium]|nr:hypothetical protein [Gammaproteobacteria bacterium]